MDDLSNKEKKDLNFLLMFLHRSKKFISPVSSFQRSWGGLMWALGWRKLFDKNQILGRYIKKFRPEEFDEYNKLFSQSCRLGEIIGTQYKQTAKSAFNNNQELMKKHNLPLFD
jgi:hypothetical protein